MKLARRLVLLVLVPFVGLIVVLGVLAAQRETQAYRGQVADDLRITGEALRSAVTELWLSEGEDRALAVLSRSDDHLPQVKIHWLSWDGDRPMQDHRLGPDEVVSLSGGHQVALVDRSPNGSSRAFVYMPVRLNGTTRGAIELSEPMDRESELIRRIVRDNVLTTVGIVLLCIFVVGFIGQRSIGRPIRALVGQARRVGLGDLSQRLTMAPKDELGELVVEMNAMCDQIAEARAKASTETQARLEALTQLRHVERLSTVGKMAAGVAHELGTPLNVISGRARMIARGRGSPDIVQNATIIDGQAQRMTAIIRQLLTFARGGTPKKVPLVLPEIAQKTLDMLRPFAKRHAVDLRLACTDNLARVDADAGQLEQVLTNLVMNAIQAMPRGGEINVSIDDVDATPPPEHGGSSGRYQRLEVRDQGTGIPRRDLDRIFEPFFTTRDVGEGTGLGLSVTHGIVRDHGGWLAVESEINKGSRFSVYLRHEVTN
jgi:two-component system, NtrC family, sensor kinase